MLRKIGFAAATLLLACTAALCQEMTDPKAIVDQATEKMLALDNYSYQVEKEGWDYDMEETANATENLVGEASGSSLTSAFTDDVEEVDADGPKWMTYANTIFFKAPWRIKMDIIRSDYLPDILIGATLKYNYEKSKTKWAIKTPKIPGFQLPRGIDTESGNFLYSNYNVDIINLNLLAKDVAPEFDGIAELEKLDGKKAYKIVFNFKDNELKEHEVDLSEWGIPEQLHFKVEPEINWYYKEKARGTAAKAVYYFDTETLALVKTEVYQPDGEIYYRKWWENVELNSLSPRDFR